MIVIGSMISLGLLPAGAGGDVDAGRRRRRRPRGQPGARRRPPRAGAARPRPRAPRPPPPTRASRRPTRRRPRGAAGWEVQALAAIMGVGVIALGIVPSPLLDLARDAGRRSPGSCSGQPRDMADQSDRPEPEVEQDAREGEVGDAATPRRSPAARAATRRSPRGPGARGAGAGTGRPRRRASPASTTARRPGHRQPARRGTVGRRPSAAHPSGSRAHAHLGEGRLRGPGRGRAGPAADGGRPRASDRPGAGIPLKFLENILADLRHAGLVAQPARRRRRLLAGAPGRRRSRSPTSSAPSRARWPRSAAAARRTSTTRARAEPLRDVWIAVRASLRSVVEHVTLADIASGRAARRTSTRLARGPGGLDHARAEARGRRAALRAPRDPDDVALGASSSASASSRVSCTGRPRSPPRELELDADLEAEVHDALDLRLAARRRAGSAVTPQVVRAHELPPQPRDRAEEAHDELVRRARRRARAGAPTCSMRPVVHDHDAVGDLHRLLLVVGDEDGRHLDLLVQPAQPGAQLGADLGVERAEGLVEQQHARLDRQRAGQGHALALAAGELRRVALR